MLAAVQRWGGGDDERPFLPRAFSVLRAPRGRGLEFLFEDVGPGTRRLCELRAGDGLWLLGPLGRRLPRAGGRAAAAARRRRRRDRAAGDLAGRAAGAPALLGFRDAPHAEGAALLHDPQVATDDGRSASTGSSPNCSGSEIDRGCAVYACGPPPMLEAVRALCAAEDVPAQLALESGMACGYGACFGCVVPTRSGYVRLCVDGPVLDAAELELVA